MVAIHEAIKLNDDSFELIKDAHGKTTLLQAFAPLISMTSGVQLVGVLTL